MRSTYMQMPVWSKKSKVVTVACAFVAALALMLISPAPAKPQVGPGAGRHGVPWANAQPQTKISPNNPKPFCLWRSFFDTNTTVILTSCDTELCSAFTPIFTEQVVCPVEEGGSCTFQITIESENFVGSNENPPLYGESGQYAFLVDGAAPSPGPVGAIDTICPNCYEWMYSNTWDDVYVGTSYAVTATVTNTKNRQKHTVEVDIGCREEKFDATGCYAGTWLANLQVAVYTRNSVLF